MCYTFASCQYENSKERFTIKRVYGETRDTKFYTQAWHVGRKKPHQVLEYFTVRSSHKQLSGQQSLSLMSFMRNFFNRLKPSATFIAIKAELA